MAIAIVCLVPLVPTSTQDITTQTAACTAAFVESWCAIHTPVVVTHVPATVPQAPVDKQTAVGEPLVPALQEATHFAPTEVKGQEKFALVGAVGFPAHMTARRRSGQGDDNSTKSEAEHS